KTPSGGGGPHTLIITDDQSTIWFTMQGGDKLASLDTKTGAIKEYPSSGGPYGLALDKAGNVWFCRMGDNKMGKLDPRSGQMSEANRGPRSAPRRVAAAPDGMLWVTLYGNGKLAKLDPAAMKVVKEYQLPGGDKGPYAVTVDGGGMVWANEIGLDTVVRLDPKTEQMRVVQLPSNNVGIRKMVVDARGRLWDMGSHRGGWGVGKGAAPPAIAWYVMPRVPHFPPLISTNRARRQTAGFFRPRVFSSSTFCAGTAAFALRPRSAVGRRQSS